MLGQPYIEMSITPNVKQAANRAMVKILQRVRMSRNPLAGFFRACAFIATSIDCGDGIEVGLSWCDVGVAECWGLYEFDIDANRRHRGFATVDVVASQIGIGIRIPDEIDKGLLASTREDGLQSGRYRGRENVVGDDCRRRGVIAGDV